MGNSISYPCRREWAHPERQPRLRSFDRRVVDAAARQIAFQARESAGIATAPLRAASRIPEMAAAHAPQGPSLPVASHPGFQAKAAAGREALHPGPSLIGTAPEDRHSRPAMGARAWSNPRGLVLRTQVWSGAAMGTQCPSS